MTKVIVPPVLQMGLEEDTAIIQGAHFLHVLPHILS